MTSDLKSSSCRSFVRVRPLTVGESRMYPEGYSASPEVLEYDGHNTITLLDPQNEFQSRKNGKFVGPEVLWNASSAKSSAGTAQQEVYNSVVHPMIPAIVTGYSTAFLVAGASGSGRKYTLYGDDVEGPTRGILPRFAEDIFDAFEKQKEVNSFLTVELEAIDVSGESYVDLLSTTRTKGEQALKLQNTADGTRLTGATCLDIDGLHDFRTVLKQLIRTVEKRNTTHSVCLRFTETFEFEDPETFNQSVAKSRRVEVLFVLLRNMPSAFQRCVDVAVEHDSGENPLAKVPVRETAFTKLYPALFQQGYHLNIISCASPFYDHARENFNTLQFSVKVRRLKGKPTLNQDENYVELRRIADEVKDLQVEARKQNDAATVVQAELNAREVELMKQEANFNKANRDIANSQTNYKLATIGRNMEAERSLRVKKEINGELNRKRSEIKKFQGEQASKDAATQKAMRDADDAKFRVEAAEEKIKKQEANKRIYDDRLAEYKKEEAEIKEMEDFNIATPDEQRRKIVADSDATKMREEEIAKVDREMAAIKASDDTEKRAGALKSDYDRAYSESAPSREKKELEAEIAKFEKDIKDAKDELAKLQGEIDQNKSQCNCTVM